MIWQDWNAFLAMGGHGAHVWGSVGAVALFVGVELVALRLRRRAALAAVRGSAA